MAGKKISESRATILHQVQPYQTNSAGKMHGGELLRLLDAAGAICAFRHARGTVVTAAIEHMEFIAPVQPGDIIMFHCSVNYVGRTSMEVGVRIEAEEHLSGLVRHVSTGYLTFVGIDELGRPRPLPPLIPENCEDNRRMADAARRLAIARMNRHKSSSACNDFCISELRESYALCQMLSTAHAPPELFQEILGLVRQRGSFFCALPETALSQFDPALFSKIIPAQCCLATDESVQESVGVLGGVGTVLASVHISLFVLSSFSNSYILFPKTQRDQAVSILEAVGHRVEKQL